MLFKEPNEVEILDLIGLDVFKQYFLQFKCNIDMLKTSNIV